MGEGDGTTFHLPDLRGRFLRGVDGGVGKDPDAASRVESNSGGNAGDTVGSVQGDEFKSHAHKERPQIGTQWLTVYRRIGGNWGNEVNGNQKHGNTDPTGGNETRPKNAYVCDFRMICVITVIKLYHCLNPD